MRLYDAAAVQVWPMVFVVVAGWMAVTTGDGVSCFGAAAASSNAHPRSVGGSHTALCGWEQEGRDLYGYRPKKRNVICRERPAKEGTSLLGEVSFVVVRSSEGINRNGPFLRQRGVVLQEVTCAESDIPQQALGWLTY